MSLFFMMPVAIYILLSIFLAQEFVSALAVRPAAALALEAGPLLRGTQRVQCPCALRLFRRRTDADLSHDLIDVLTTRERRADRPVTWWTAQRQNVRAASEHSVLNISMLASTRSDNLFHHFKEIKIDEAGTFIVSLQPSQNKSAALNMEDYFLSARPLSRIPRACPAKLGPYQPVRRGVPPGRVEDWVAAPSEKLPAIEPRVVGGTIASGDLASYMVVVYNPNGNYCSGALLSGRWGITSAHCLMSANFTVGVMTTQARVDGVRIGVRRVITHPLYATATREWDYDVTVFELEKDAPPGWRAMVVNTNIERPRRGAFARVAGYGYKSEDNEAPDLLPGRLRQVDLPVVGQEKCAEAFEGIRSISARSQACAGYLGVGGCDTCQGDSGAPLFRYTDSGDLLLLGITSFGIGCARPQFPGVYLRAASVVPWLRQTPAVFSTFSGSAGDWEAETPSPTGQ